MAAAAPIYVPRQPPGGDRVPPVADWAYRELQFVARLFSGQPWIQLIPQGAAPPVPRPGMVAYANGTTWNPGNGEGLYVYKSTGWKFLG